MLGAIRNRNLDIASVVIYMEVLEAFHIMCKWLTCSTQCSVKKLGQIPYLDFHVNLIDTENNGKSTPKKIVSADTDYTGLLVAYSGIIERIASRENSRCIEPRG